MILVCKLGLDKDVKSLLDKHLISPILEVDDRLNLYITLDESSTNNMGYNYLGHMILGPIISRWPGRDF